MNNKRFTLSQLAVILLVVILLFQASELLAGDEYGWVCHKPGTPAEQSKYLPREAHGSNDVNGHLGHGDTAGKCASDQESTPTPVPPTPVPPTATPVPPTSTPVPPTATPVPPTATPTQKPTSEVTSTQVPPPASTATPTATRLASQPASTPASCEPAADYCDPCDVVMAALAQGKVILILDETELRIIDSEQVSVQLVSQAGEMLH